MKKYFSLTLFLVVTLIFLSGCTGDLITPGTENNSTSPTQEDGVVPGKGILKIYLTDAPGDYLEVNITISKIEAHIAGDNEENNDEDNKEDKGSWEVLKEWDEGLLVDLIKLEDVSILLASLELEPNKYTQLRLFLKEDAWLVLNDSDLEPVLEIPSSATSGIKLNRPFEIIAGMITKLTIDFDAEKSVVKTGNGKYKLKPVINVTSETYSEGEELPEGSGSVSGTVSYYYSQDLELTGIGGASVELSGGVYIFANTTTTSEVEGLEGIFSLNNVPAGNYTLNVYTDDYGNYSEDIEVVAGEDTVVNVVFLLEEPGTISGSVVDLLSGLPISEASVSVTLSGGSTYIFSSSTLTDINGGFTIGQLPVGFYTLTVSADDYGVYSHAVEIEVTEGITTNIDEIGLTPLPPSL